MKEACAPPAARGCVAEAMGRAPASRPAPLWTSEHTFAVAGDVRVVLQQRQGLHGVRGERGAGERCAGARFVAGDAPGGAACSARSLFGTTRLAAATLGRTSLRAWFSGWAENFPEWGRCLGKPVLIILSNFQSAAPIPMH